LQFFLVQILFKKYFFYTQKIHKKNNQKNQKQPKTIKISTENYFSTHSRSPIRFVLCDFAHKCRRVRSPKIKTGITASEQASAAQCVSYIYSFSLFNFLRDWTLGGRKNKTDALLFFLSLARPQEDATTSRRWERISS
jgi:hypothetical protein